MNHMENEMRMGILAAVVMTAGLCVAGEGKRPMGLLMMWDGTRADMIVNADLPNLRKLAGGTWQAGYNGAWSFCARPIEDARAYSFANHASILNGVSRAKHGVAFNHRSYLCRTDKWPMFMSRLMDANPAFRATWVYACGDGDWLLCRDDRVDHRNFGVDDDGKVDYLVGLLSSGQTPDMSIAYMDEPDGTGHATAGYYPTGEKYRKAVEKCDALLGRLLDAIAARPTFAEEDWLIVVTADHGGYHNMHGWEDAHSRTAPLVMSGRHVVKGQLAGSPHMMDIAPTFLRHFGHSVEGLELDGVPIGGEGATWGAASSIGEKLTWYYPMLEKKRTKFLNNAVEGGPGSELFGDEEYFGPNRGNGQFESHCLWIAGAEGVPCGAALGDSTDLFLTPHPECTIAFWAKVENRPGPIAVLGNKDFARSGSPGFVITTGCHTERTGNGMCVVFGTPRGEDVTVGTYDIEYGEWGFYALVFTREGQVWFYQGRRDGSFHWIAESSGRALLGSGLPICLGNDGTGCYRWNYMDYLDDIAIWRRPLAIDEVRSIFNAGRKGRELKDIIGLTVKESEPGYLLDTTEKAGVGTK